MHLRDIHSPKDIQQLSYAELNDLALEIRREIISTVSTNGGHLASNLGAVELTLALHRAFAMPEDKIIFDVGHQSYVHKLLTGRLAQFATLRTFGGMAGFPKRSESEYDVFETGHSSTAISAALGMARARDLMGQDHHVVAVVGDGALTGGMCYEALNDAGSTKTRLIVILNDNEMSIAPNVGALSSHLTQLRISHGWTSTKMRVKHHLPHVPVVGKPLYHCINWAKDKVKSLMVDEGFFGTLGFHYYGPIDGHDVRSMERTFRQAQGVPGPVVIHVLTKKGYGYDKAEERPERFHGIAPFYAETGEARKAAVLPSFGQVMSETLAAQAENDPRIVTITAAMASGTGLDVFAQRYPQRMMDVGITEEHAVTMAAGLAAAGMKPYFAVYASFFQRSYDQMIHDVAMQELPVTMLLDRAGLVGEDGETHHGVYDLASMLPVPNMTVLAPRDLGELRAMLAWAQHFDKPLAIRYGRTSVDMPEYPCRQFAPGRWETMAKGSDLTILAVGSMVQPAMRTRALLEDRGIHAAVVNCSTVKPMDEVLLAAIRTPVVTLEEHVLQGGFGSQVCVWCAAHRRPAPLLMLGIPDQFVQHGSRNQLLRMLGLDPESMAQRIQAAWKENMNDER